jgi:hypothetical protein
MVELPGAEGSYGSRLIASIAGVPVRTVSTVPVSLPDVVLVSVHFPGDFTGMMKLVRNLGIDPNPLTRKAPFVVLGGYGCNNPEPALGIANAVQVGDGEQFAEALRDGADPRAGDCDDIDGYTTTPESPASAWGIGEQRRSVVANQHGLLTGDAITCRTHGSDHLPTVELARGCKTRCAFCAVGNTKAFRELPEALALEHAKSSTRQRRMFAADLGSISYWEQHAELLASSSGGMSVRSAMKRPRALALLPQPSMGIEGWSERLRRLVGKPITDAELREVMAVRLRAGKHQAMWYMMHSLPTSSIGDRLQFLELVRSLPSAAMLRLSFTPFQKLAGAPLAYAPAAYMPDEREFLETMRKRFETPAKKTLQIGKGEVRHYVDTLASCGTRAIARLFVEHGEAMLNWPLPKLRAVAKHYGNDLDAICSEWPETKELPWGYVDFGMGDPRDRYERSIKPAILESTGQPFPDVT